MPATDLKKIQGKLAEIRQEIANLQGRPKIARLIDQIEALLPGTKKE